jgi:ADP-ribosylglycohydrolase
MIGAIAGDIIVSVYEKFVIKTTDFPLFKKRSRFTDDTVLTVAIAEAVLKGSDYAASLKSWTRRYPLAGYGPRYSMWVLLNRSKPYNSWGNGSAMRVSPVGFAFDDLGSVLEEAGRTALVTHNHPEGVKGARAAAAAVFMARQGESKEKIKDYVAVTFGYDLDRKLDDIRPGYKFDVSCQGTVPESIIAFLESEDFEDAVRKAVSLGGDSDTLACITGAIAQAFYRKIPADIVANVRKKLPEKMLAVIDEFSSRYKLL